MKRLPFNSCDYRCSRCLETAECAVFQKLQERLLLQRLSGTGENDPESILADIRESFRETEEMIKQKARDAGIDIDQIAGDSSAEETAEQRKKTEADALYKKTLEFTAETGKFLQRANGLIRKEAGEYFDDVAWHHTIVPAKIYRALGWRTDKDVDIAMDGKNSAAVAMKSLTICIMALDHLGSNYAGLSDDCRRLTAAGRSIKEEIKSRFKIGRSPA